MHLTIFWTFLKLGCTSFGGPIAHLMYFRTTFVQKLAWLTEQEYASLVALCQSLPGPASSQVGFGIGVKQGGIAGGIVAFLAFTLPSVILLIVFAHYLYLFDSNYGQAALGGLAILAFAVVLQGVLGMGKTFCSSAPTYAISLFTFIAVLLMQSALMQLAVIALGAFVNAVLNALPYKWSGSVSSSPTSTGPEKTSEEHLNPLLTNKPSHGLSVCWVLLFAGLFVALPFISTLANDYYRAGALVFGGGHVVLPLLEQIAVATGSISQADFLAGYGATQAVPGPMFSFAAYLGFLEGGSEQLAKASLDGALASAAIASMFIFLPGFLLVLALLPYWKTLNRYQTFRSALSGANAAVVGLLAAALYDPIFVHAIRSASDLAIAALAFACLMRFKLPVLWVVLGCIAAKMLVAALG
ncbi:chromate efflux transporter [Glaciecola siphonariae]|uniref:Chromate efflux transporter n=1 Tax=Glaciecola siphonariae TaxID=521012 RepID=A0ABV9LZH9_9ALTE